MSSLRMTSIVISSCLVARRERQKSDVARLLDRVGQTPLVRRAHAADPPRNNLPALGDKCVQHLDVFVVDVVDLLDAEPAHFLAPEVLLLLSGNRLVAAGGPLAAADGSSAFGFRHGLCLL